VNAKVKELLQTIHMCQSYTQNKSGTFLWTTVYINDPSAFVYFS